MVLSDVLAFIFDLDGTLYLEGELFDGVLQTLDAIRKSGKRVLFLTNNDSVSLATYSEKLKKLHLTSDSDDIVSSSLATIFYLKEQNLCDGVYLVGTNELKKDYIQSGINLVEDNPKTCVLAFDRELDYEKLCKITKFITKGANYIATHEDINCPAKDVYVPDVGSFMSLIEKSTGKVPQAICGKPREIMARYISKKLNLPLERIAMVGDRLMTDIAFGINNNMTSILVLSGESTLADLEKSGLKPTLVLQSVNDILKYM